MSEHEESGLLDLLILVAENAKLLVLGSLLAGLAALGIASIVPVSYVSTATVALPKPLQVATPGQLQAVFQTQTPVQAAAMMVSPSILDSAVAQLKLAQQHSTDAARRQLMDHVRTTVGADGLVHLEVTAATPQSAQATADTIINAWLESTRPSEQERVDLERILRNAEASLNTTHRLMEQMTAQPPASRGETSTALLAVADLQTRYLIETLEVSQMLRGLSRDVVMQAPTLPVDPDMAPKGLAFALGALAALVALLLWLVSVQALRTSANDPRTLAKVQRLRSTLGLKPPSK